jgi:hypothetical protein
LLHIPQDFNNIVYFGWEYTAGTLAATGNWNFIVNGLKPGLGGYVAGGITVVNNPTFPATNQLLSQDLTALVPPILLSGLAGGYLGVRMQCIGMAGMNNKNFGVRLIYN